MIKIEIGKNEEGQRLDRFLRKYYGNAPLSYIYKLIRKDVKVNGKRCGEEALLREGDEIYIYITEELSESYRRIKRVRKSKKQFKVVYEDENILVADKPFGLLVHGSNDERKHHLTNQVQTYLMEKGDFVPSREKTFAPAPANRLDRNTTGLVIFGKTAGALQDMNRMIREREFVSKYYLTIVAGKLTKSLILKDKIEKDGNINTVKLRATDEEGGKASETIAVPVCTGKDYTLVEVELVTGRTHQIRAHLAGAGYPIIGDSKYGKTEVNRVVERQFKLSTQFLHAYRLKFYKGTGCLEYLAGKEIRTDLPDNLNKIKEILFKE